MTSEGDSDWPLSVEEMLKIRDRVAAQVSFVDILANTVSNVEEIGASSFTHKCTCPNPKHKNGQERTPSFFFSEETKTFNCFGCGWHGDTLTLLSLFKGRPWEFILRDIIKDNKISLDDLPAKVSYSNYFFELNLKVSSKYRDYLFSMKDSPNYKKERKWVDAAFVRIDDRFSKLTDNDSKSAFEFVSQMLMELDRRVAKNKIEEEGK